MLKNLFYTKTTKVSIIGLGLSFFSFACKILHFNVDGIEYFLWACAFLAFIFLRDGIEYNKDKAFVFETEATLLERRRQRFKPQFKR